MTIPYGLKMPNIEAFIKLMDSLMPKFDPFVKVYFTLFNGISIAYGLFYAEFDSFVKF